MDFTHNAVFQVISVFHVPLFFLVSGFFFTSSIRLSTLNFLKKKSIQFVIPSLVWAIIFMAIDLIINVLQHKTFQFDTIRYHALYCEVIHCPNTDLLQLLKNLWFLTIGFFWFFRELFISFILSFISLKIIKNQLLAFLITIIFLIILPFDFSQQLFLLPIFWFGIFLKKYYENIKRHANIIIFVSGIIFLLCILFWNGSYSVYFRPISYAPFNINIRAFPVACFHWLFALDACLFWFVLFMKIYRNNLIFRALTYAGTYTMGIYIFQKFILEILLNKLFDFPNVNIWVYNFVIMPLIAMIVGFVCIFIIKLFEKNKTLLLLLIGNVRK